MNIVRQRLDPGGKVLGVGHDVAARVALHLPAIVDHDVLIAGVLHAGLDHGVGHLPNQVFVHIAAKLCSSCSIPSVECRPAVSLVPLTRDDATSKPNMATRILTFADMVLKS